MADDEKAGQQVPGLTPDAGDKALALGGAFRVRMRPDTPAVAIDEQDFEILLEGSGASSATSHAWVFWGIAITALVGAGGVHASADISKIPEGGHVSTALVWFMGFLAIAVVFGVLGSLRYRDAKKLAERKVYIDVVNRVRGEIAVSKKAK